MQSKLRIGHKTSRDLGITKGGKDIPRTQHTGPRSHLTVLCLLMWKPGTYPGCALRMHHVIANHWSRKYRHLAAHQYIIFTQRHCSSVPAAMIWQICTCIYLHGRAAKGDVLVCTAASHSCNHYAAWSLREAVQHARWMTPNRRQCRVDSLHCRSCAQGAAAMLELLQQTPLHAHQQPFVRRCALLAASQACPRV